jgi:cytochrome b6-f complex iron-sulfur subunit
MTRRSKRERRPSTPPVDDAPVTGSARAPDTSPPPSRRAFLWKTWLGLAGLAMVELIWVVVDFLRPRRRDVATSDAVIVAGPVDRFAPASVTAFPAGRFYLVRTEEGGFLAVSRECTHLGCTVPWSAEENKFVCPCHGSAFDLRGDVVNPPAPRALDLFEVRIENRVVKVNTANVRRRNTFDVQQVTWA